MKANDGRRLLCMMGGRRSGVGVKPQIAMGLISKFTLNFDQNGQCYSGIDSSIHITAYRLKNASPSNKIKKDLQAW